jgi:hypothetical protein
MLEKLPAWQQLIVAVVIVGAWLHGWIWGKSSEKPIRDNSTGTTFPGGTPPNAWPTPPKLPQSGGSR